MSAFDQETIDVEAEIERRTNERVQARLAAAGVKPAVDEAVLSAEITAAGSPDEIKSALAKAGRLQEDY